MPQYLKRTLKDKVRADLLCSNLISEMVLWRSLVWYWHNVTMHVYAHNRVLCVTDDEGCIIKLL